MVMVMILHGSGFSRTRTGDDHLGRPKLRPLAGAHVLTNPFRSKAVTLHTQDIH